MAYLGSLSLAAVTSASSGRGHATRRPSQRPAGTLGS